ncbi:hypothetical protein QUF73_24860 [Cytobacillus sp. NJ13]|nr:hypothetical protein [Cytobacillus sp. NJ13]
MEKENLFFDVEFQLNEKGQYISEVLIGSKLSGRVLMTAELRPFDSLEELKNGAKEFETLFLQVYEVSARKVMREKGLETYGE